MFSLKINNELCQTIVEVRENASSAVVGFLEEWNNDKDYIIAHTSGSTGTPKEIRLLKKDMVQSARNTNSFFSLDSESIFYLNLSPTYIAGKMMIVRAIEAKGMILEEEPSNNPLADYSGCPIDLCAFVPSQLISLFNNPDRLRYIKNMIIGGGSIPEKLHKKIVDYGISAYSTYGMTETCSHIALAPVTASYEPYEVVGDNTIEIDERGCLVINLPSFSVNKIVTNDIVELIDDRHFYWKGRFDNVINSGGIKIFPEEIEAKIASLFPNTRFFITSRKSEKWGSELVLALEYKSLASGEVKEGEIIPAFVEKMKNKLANCAVPRYYIAVSQFETTSSGKIKRTL